MILKRISTALLCTFIGLGGVSAANEWSDFSYEVYADENDFVIVPYAEWHSSPNEYSINTYERLDYGEVDIPDDALVLVKYNGNDDKVIIPEGVNIISYNAFNNNESITEIIMPNSVKGLTWYEEYHRGTEGHSMQYIGAFDNCTELKNVVLSDSLRTIPSFTYHNCSSLEQLNTKNVTEIKGGAFGNCTSLKKVEVNNDCLFSCTTTGAQYYPSSKEFKIGAFTGCSSLEIISGDVMLTLEDYALSGCESLISVEGLVDIIGTKALGGNIDTLVISGSLIPEKTFYNCKVKSLVIPKTITKIGEEKSFNYDLYVSEEHPAYLNNVTDIFYEGTEAEWKKISKPSDSRTERIHYNTSDLKAHKFEDVCKKIIYDDVNQEYVIDITYCSACNSILEGGNRRVKATKKIENGNDSYLIDDNNALVAYVGDGGDVVIPKGVVTSIEKDAFWNDNNITSVTIPEGVTHLNGYAFMAGVPSDTGTKPNIAPNMKTLYLPNSIKSIESYDEESYHYNLTAMGIYGKRYYILAWVYAYTYMGLENVKEIYYNGTKDEWEKVEGIDELSEEVTVHFVKAESSIENVHDVFTDVPDGKWYSKEILYVYKRGAMKGKSEGVFDPLALIQRSETIAMLYQLEGSPAVDTSKALFPDVTSKNWYNNAATWGKTNGIISGLSSGPDAGKFMPKNQITRQDFTKILYEYAKYKGYDVSVKSATSYTEVEDASLISKYARECMNWGYENKFIANGSNFKPKDNITRREAAVMLARFLEKYDYK